MKSVCGNAHLWSSVIVLLAMYVAHKSLFKEGYDKITQATLGHRQEALIPCDRFDISEENCKQKGCSWISHKINNAPSCFYQNNVGYIKTGNVQKNRTKWTIRLKRKGQKKVFGMEVHQYMTLEIDQYSINALRIYFYPDENVFEIPDEALPIRRPKATSHTNEVNETSGTKPKHTFNKETDNNQNYRVKLTTSPIFGIQVIRRLTSTTIFNTTLPGLIFSRQFLQLSTKLSSDNIYGFGAHSQSQFRRDMRWKKWPIFARAARPKDSVSSLYYRDEEWNYYGAHTTYMNLEEDGKANMVFLKNSNAMDIFLQPNPYPAITYRTIGGVLDFYIFLGSSPQEALQHYTEAIGRPIMPPYWSLGFHMVKWGQRNLSDVEMVMERNKRAHIPQDGQWLDIDYMDEYFLFTYSKDRYKDLPVFVQKLHRDGQRLVVIVNPAVNIGLCKEIQRNRPRYNIFADGKLSEVYIKTTNGSILRGQLWSKELVTFVDFTNFNKTLPWWEYYIRYLYNEENVKFDGLWLDKNEPDNNYEWSLENKCERNTWNYPPYVPNIGDGKYDGGSIYARTICMESKQQWGRHYDIHNLYGHSMSIVTNRAMQSIFQRQRPFVITRSSFAGTGKYAVTLLGDNMSWWGQMSKSIVAILDYSLFGFSMVGADICGFNENTTYELCLRWSQLGAFYPLARNHNRRWMKDQDPAAWDNAFIDIVRKVLRLRYRILPYMYTLYHDAHVYGHTVARPLFFEFPNDKSTKYIFKQFLLGPAFLISPVLEQGARTANVYFPKSRWYNLFNGKEVMNTEVFHTINAPLDIINLHLRGGYILPIQEPDNTTLFSRKQEMGLLVSFDENFRSSGYLFWDDGESKDTYERGNYLFLNFNASKNSMVYFLEISVVHNGYPGADSLVFGNIEMYGMDRMPKIVTINDKHLQTSNIKEENRIFKFINLNLKITDCHLLRWTN